MTVWDDLVGQDRVAEQLRTAAGAAHAVLAGEGVGGMTHAWLFTGPPGVGTATAARAFAAALQCVSPDLALGAEPGCGHCDGCHTALTGTHADVDVVATELLSIGVKETRDLVRRAAMTPAGGRWQVIILEDAGRLTEGAGNVLLKAIEEPADRTVWLLCAPSLEDALPTIRSRCRNVALRTPPAGAVADLLMRRDGIEPAMAAFAAAASGGDINSARRLALDEQARGRRSDVLRIPMVVGDIGLAMAAAQRLVDAAAEDAKQVAADLDGRETEDLRAALGAVGGGRMPSGTAGVMKELENKQKKRATRTQRDCLDRALVDLTAFYRDVLALQLRAAVPLANDVLRADLDTVARTSTPDATLRRIEAILACRRAIDANVAPLLAVEAMVLTLRTG